MVIDNIVLFVNEDIKLGVSRVDVFRLWSMEPRFIRHRVVLSPTGPTTSALVFCDGV